MHLFAPYGVEAFFITLHVGCHFVQFPLINKLRLDSQGAKQSDAGVHSSNWFIALADRYIANLFAPIVISPDWLSLVLLLYKYLGCCWLTDLALAYRIFSLWLPETFLNIMAWSPVYRLLIHARPTEGRQKVQCSARARMETNMDNGKKKANLGGYTPREEPRPVCRSHRPQHKLGFSTSTYLHTGRLECVWLHGVWMDTYPRSSWHFALQYGVFAPTFTITLRFRDALKAALQDLRYY